MSIPSKREILQVIENSFDLAVEGINSGSVGVLKKAANARFMESIDHIRKSKITGVRHLEHVAVLSVDLRGSSALTLTNNVDNIFISFQCFLPMVIFIARKMNGEVIGLRGDGLLSTFGIGESDIHKCVDNAFQSGMVMLEATYDVLNPFLSKNRVPILFEIGGGIDYGQVAFTKIGFDGTQEVTGYGVPVNTAAKNSNGKRELWLSAAAHKAWKPQESDSGIYPQKLNRIPQ